MAFSGRGLVFAGDLLAFALSLWVTLLLRYGGLPSPELLAIHVVPFALLFLLWALVFYMAGLYTKRALLSQSELAGALLRTQLLNIMLAGLFFFVTPVGITPKTTLALYLVVSLALIFIWRLMLLPRIAYPSARERAALVGSGADATELVAEVNKNPRYRLEFVVHQTSQEVVDNFEKFAARLQGERVTMLVVDTSDETLKPALERIYALSFLHERYYFADLYRVYEEIFDRVPLSLLRYDWFLKNLSLTPSGFYSIVKRLIDIVGALLMGVLTVIITPLVWFAIQFEGSGNLFIAQERLGQYGDPLRVYKFGSMRFNKTASSEWTIEEKQHNPVTKVGAFLRRTSLDEFPQFISILRGEMSLVGPRNDIMGLGMRLAETLPYYMARYMVKPGITGWAQINQRYEPGNISPQSIEETKGRLAYDFYYVKNRSLALDILILLRTVKRMLFRVSPW